MVRPSSSSQCFSFLPLLLVVQVADHEVAGLDLALLRHLGLALLHALGAAGVELAACGGIGGGRNGTLQHNAVHLGRGVRHGDGGEQGLGVGVQRILEDILGGAVFHQVARYMTPTVSEMCSTTDRSWEMNR